MINKQTNILLSDDWNDAFDVCSEGQSYRITGQDDRVGC